MFFVNCLRAPDDSLVQLSYLNPRLPSSLHGVEINPAFSTKHSSPSSLFFALLQCGGCAVLVGHAALDRFTEKKVQALTNSFLQSHVPERRSLVLGFCFGGKRDPHSRAGLTAYVQDVAD